MKPERWKLVRRLLKQEEGFSGRLVMAVAPSPLDIVLYECPVLVRTQPPHNPLRGFVQETILLLGNPIAAEIANFLYLPQGIVELILANLQQLGGASNDSVGRWSIPSGAPRFRNDRGDPPIWRGMRRLICYWPDRQMILPAIPRLRLRDLVELNVHRLQGKLIDQYHDLYRVCKQQRTQNMTAMLRVLPLVESDIEASALPNADEGPDTPVQSNEVLVTECQLDVVGLVWATKDEGVWEIRSRLWSRPTTKDESEGEPFAAGQPEIGLALPEFLMGRDCSLDALGDLFSSHPTKWRSLSRGMTDEEEIRRQFDCDYPSILISESDEDGKPDHWRGLHCSLGQEARLLCYVFDKKNAGMQKHHHSN